MIVKKKKNINIINIIKKVLIIGINKNN